MRTIRTPTNRSKILRSLSSGMSIAHACRAAGIGRMTYYEWYRDDPEFRADADDAIEAGTDHLEDSAMKRALAGDTGLTTFLLKARRPEKYRERVEQKVVGDEDKHVTFVFRERASGGNDHHGTV